MDRMLVVLLTPHALFTTLLLYAVEQAESLTEGLEPVCKDDGTQQYRGKCKDDGSTVIHGKTDTFIGSPRQPKLSCAFQHWHCIVQEVPWW